MSPLTDRAGDPQREIAGAGADLARGIAGTQTEGFDHFVGFLPGGAVGAIEALEIVGKIVGVAVLVVFVFVPHLLLLPGSVLSPTISNPGTELE
jgi:hypothetical protein